MLFQFDQLNIKVQEVSLNRILILVKSLMNNSDVLGFFKCNFSDEI